MIIDRGVPFRPDWENVITPVVDYLLTRPEVDPARIALIGLSFGGYLAPRAATAEHRLAAVHLRLRPLRPVRRDRAPPARLPRQRSCPTATRPLLRLLDRLVRVVMSKPTAGWALRRNLMVHGLSDPLEFFRIAPQYSLKGIEDRIQCPTFVCSAEDDDLSVDAGKLYDALTCPKRYYRFSVRRRGRAALRKRRPHPVPPARLRLARRGARPRARHPPRRGRTAVMPNGCGLPWSPCTRRNPGW